MKVAALGIAVNNTTSKEAPQVPSAAEATVEQFLETARRELKRAERYRVFVSLATLTIDLSASQLPLQDHLIVEKVSRLLRACDIVSAGPDHRLSLLFPETSRQGAEVAVRRLIHTLTTDLHLAGASIHADLVSFPDAVGARSLADYLSDLANRSMN